MMYMCSVHWNTPFKNISAIRALCRGIWNKRLQRRVDRWQMSVLWRNPWNICVCALKIKEDLREYYCQKVGDRLERTLNPLNYSQRAIIRVYPVDWSFAPRTHAHSHTHDVWPQEIPKHWGMASETPSVSNDRAVNTHWNPSLDSVALVFDEFVVIYFQTSHLHVKIVRETVRINSLDSLDTHTI